MHGGELLPQGRKRCGGTTEATDTSGSWIPQQHRRLCVHAQQPRFISSLASFGSGIAIATSASFTGARRCCSIYVCAVQVTQPSARTGPLKPREATFLSCSALAACSESNFLSAACSQISVPPGGRRHRHRHRRVRLLDDRAVTERSK